MLNPGISEASTVELIRLEISYWEITHIGYIWWILLYVYLIPAICETVIYESSEPSLLLGSGHLATSIGWWKGLAERFRLHQQSHWGAAFFRVVVFSPLFGEDFHFDSYFLNGLKPPTTGSFFPKTPLMFNCWFVGLGPGGLDSWDFYWKGLGFLGVSRFESQTNGPQTKN